MSEIPDRRVPRYNCKFCGNIDKVNPAECYTERGRDKCPHWATFLLSGLKADKPQEKVDHPQHYGGDTTYETIKVLAAWMTAEQLEGFCVGNAIKYMSRYQAKGGREDLEKAQWYLEWYLTKMGGE